MSQPSRLLIESARRIQSHTSRLIQTHQCGRQARRDIWLTATSPSHHGSHFKPRIRTSANLYRQFSISPASRHGHLDKPNPGEELHVTFVDKDGDKHEFEVSKGDNLLDIAQANDLEMEGACGGSCACSTCHVIVQDPDMYDKMAEPDDDENDMLDLAFGLTETSRLGCQVKMDKDLDGLIVKLPAMTRNLQKSDFGDKNTPKGSH